MTDQIIISIGREYGSGGHLIAEKLAERLSLPVYDRNMLEHIAMEKNTDLSNLHEFDELPKNPLFTRTVRGHSNSYEEIVANMQFEYIKNKAEAGESFVVVGRAAEHILRDKKGLISIFILADEEEKIQRIMEVRGFDRTKAISALRRHDKKRKAYHNSYCQGSWGDARNYDITINSSHLGIDGTTDLLEDYVKEYIKCKLS